MVPVSTAPAPTQNTWTCPTCHHGSPDPRDELAHLDAHRQLGRFLREWDEAVVSDRLRERRRHPAVGALTGLVVLAIVVAGILFSGLIRIGGSSNHVAGPVPASIAPAPAPTQPPPAEASVPVTPQVTPADPPRPAPQTPPVAAATAAAAPAVVPAPSATRADAGVISVAASTPPASGATTTLKSLRDAATLAPTHLLEICLLGTCLTIP